MGSFGLSTCYNTSMPEMIVTIVSLLLVLLLGWVAGALVNYLADVLPSRRKLAAPFCLECGAPVTPVNYLIWPRRCTVCGRRRHWRMWLVEIGSMALVSWLWLSPPSRIDFLLGLILVIYFGVVVVIDMEHRLILHPVSIAGAVIGLIVGIWLHGVWATLLGGAAGFAAMFAIYYAGVLLMRFLAHRRGETLEEEAIGFGDVNLSGVLGLILGWPGIVGGLTLAILIGGAASLVYLVWMLLFGRYRSFMAIPYGPFLIAGTFVLLFVL